MGDLWFERTTAAILRDAFRVDTQVPNATTSATGPASDPAKEPAKELPRLPYWLYGGQSQATGFSRYDIQKASEGASL